LNRILMFLHIGDHLKTSQSAIISQRAPPAIPNNQPLRARGVTKYDNQKRRLVTIRSHRRPITRFRCCKETAYARRVAESLLPCPTCHPAPRGRPSVHTQTGRPPKCPPTRKWATGTRKGTEGGSKCGRMKTRTTVRSST
jgi:hypothetical protein